MNPGAVMYTPTPATKRPRPPSSIAKSRLRSSISSSINGADDRAQPKSRPLSLISNASDATLVASTSSSSIDPESPAAYMKFRQEMARSGLARVSASPGDIGDVSRELDPEPSPGRQNDSMMGKEDHHTISSGKGIKPPIGLGLPSTIHLAGLPSPSLDVQPSPPPPYGQELPSAEPVPSSPVHPRGDMPDNDCSDVRGTPPRQDSGHPSRRTSTTPSETGRPDVATLRGNPHCGRTGDTVEDEDHLRAVRAAEAARAMGLEMDFAFSNAESEDGVEDDAGQMSEGEIRRKLLSVRKRLKQRDKELLMAAKVADQALKQHEEVLNHLSPSFRSRIPQLLDMFLSHPSSQQPRDRPGIGHKRVPSRTANQGTSTRPRSGSRRISHIRHSSSRSMASLSSVISSTLSETIKQGQAGGYFSVTVEDRNHNHNRRSASRSSTASTSASRPASRSASQVLSPETQTSDSPDRIKTLRQSAFQYPHIASRPNARAMNPNTLKMSTSSSDSPNQWRLYLLQQEEAEGRIRLLEEALSEAQSGEDKQRKAVNRMKREVDKVKRELERAEERLTEQGQAQLAAYNGNARDPGRWQWRKREETIRKDLRKTRGNLDGLFDQADDSADEVAEVEEDVDPVIPPRRNEAESSLRGRRVTSRGGPPMDAHRRSESSRSSHRNRDMEDLEDVLSKMSRMSVGSKRPHRSAVASTNNQFSEADQFSELRDVFDTTRTSKDDRLAVLMDKGKLRKKVSKSSFLSPPKRSDPVFNPSDTHSRMAPVTPQLSVQGPDDSPSPLKSRDTSLHPALAASRTSRAGSSRSIRHSPSPARSLISLGSISLSPNYLSISNRMASMRDFIAASIGNPTHVASLAAGAAGPDPATKSVLGLRTLGSELGSEFGDDWSSPSKPRSLSVSLPPSPSPVSRRHWVGTSILHPTGSTQAGSSAIIDDDADWVDEPDSIPYSAFSPDFPLSRVVDDHPGASEDPTPFTSPAALPPKVSAALSSLAVAFGPASLASLWVEAGRDRRLRWVDRSPSVHRMSRGGRSGGKYRLAPSPSPIRPVSATRSGSRSTDIRHNSADQIDQASESGTVDTFGRLENAGKATESSGGSTNDNLHIETDAASVVLHGATSTRQPKYGNLAFGSPSSQRPRVERMGSSQSSIALAHRRISSLPASALVVPADRYPPAMRMGNSRQDSPSTPRLSRVKHDQTWGSATDTYEPQTIPGRIVHDLLVWLIILLEWVEWIVILGIKVGMDLRYGQKERGIL